MKTQYISGILPGEGFLLAENGTLIPVTARYLPTGEFVENVEAASSAFENDPLCAPRFADNAHPHHGPGPDEEPFAPLMRPVYVPAHNASEPVRVCSASDFDTPLVAPRWENAR